MGHHEPANFWFGPSAVRSKVFDNSPNDTAKKHRLSLVLVGPFSPATNGSLVLMTNGSLSLVTVGCEDRRGPTTTDVFCCIIWANRRPFFKASPKRLLLRICQQQEIAKKVTVSDKFVEGLKDSLT